jgi:peptidylprolyl isomerase
MNRIAVALLLPLAASVYAQTAAKPAKPASSTSSAKNAASAPAASASTYQVPADEKRVPGIPKTAFSLRYQEIKIGTGPEGEAGKLWHVKYKGWRAKDGVVFDSWDKHGQPVMDKDGKPEMGADGKPKMSDPEPMIFPQGVGRMIPGFDYGLTGMHVGGKRRLFIPYEMAYGTHDIPDRGPDHPGIPGKSDLIFDVELVAVTDMPAQPQRPMPVPGAPGQPGTPPPSARPATPPPTGASAAPAAPPVQATTPAPDAKPASQPQSPDKK